ncbi:MAG: Chaperone protein DnaK [Chthoniobacteraceae bacterium]|nr:Chaperone protein DnaK [Chthoniobacteraceae bacterium]
MNQKEQLAYDEASRAIEQCRSEGKSSKLLDLSERGLTVLPPEIGQLTTLTELDLNRNQLTSLPPELGQLTALKGLYIKRNQLTALPREIGQLKALTALNLFSNRLTALPGEIGRLTALTELNLNRNQLTALTPEIGQLTALKGLYLNSNQLMALPAEIGQLRALKELYLNSNQLTALPPEIGQLTALRELDLNSNQLTALPSEIGQLTVLAALYVRNNRLAVLAAEVGQLTALRILILEGNALAALPDSLQYLNELRELTLHGNYALELPPDLLGPTWAQFGPSDSRANPRAILDFYFARQSQGVAPMREVRVLLVGRGRVGKTSLLKVLRGGTPDLEELETLGITVLPLELRCTQGTATAHAWDFGGQEFLHGTHQIFLSERCVYLLVLEGRESNWETETDYWIRFIQSYGGDSPVIVALNKYDDHKFSVDRFRLQERCPQIVGFVETDAFTGRGVASLRVLLEETVNRMADVWIGVPKRWHRVKEALIRMPENFFDYKGYQALCARMGIAEERQQESLAETLHRLGIALNFRNHHRLRETSVLKPQWVTEGIYGLLRFAQSNVCHGVIEKARLSDALPPEAYPTEKHGFVLELMEKFEVAFALESQAGQSNEPTHWLIPELLPEVQPATFSEFRAPGVRRLRFSYPEALPPALLPRLIVRTHEMSAAHPEWRWRSGVVLEWGGDKALLRLDRLERRTEVAVLGSSQEDAQSLFDMIRAHLAVLHGEVPVLEEVAVMEQQEWIKMKELRLAERDKDSEIKIVVGKGAEERRIALPVVATLDTVESVEARNAEGPAAPPRLRLFVSYAHADERKLKLALSTHLTILGRRGYIQAWDDKQLVAGDEWKDRIIKELSEADIVLLIYSNQARASRFIQETEVPTALELVRQKKCVLIVVPLDRKDWNENLALERELKKLQTATWNAIPVMDFKPQRNGWLEVEHSICKAVEARRKVMHGRL